MFKGLATNELYDNCIKSGFCKGHLKELQIKGESQKHEFQRKTLLYIRLQLLRPILFDKPFPTEKIKALLVEAERYFNIGTNIVPPDDFIEQVLTLDSVVVFILTKLSSVCCAGAIFQSYYRASTDNPLSRLLIPNQLVTKDYSYLQPLLNANFSNFDEGLIKVCYVSTLLYVRNVSIYTSLKKMLNQQDLVLQNLSKEGAQWSDVGSDAYKRQNWEEAVDAFTKAIVFNPYSVSLLMSRAHSYMELKKYKEAALDCYLALMIKPTHYVAYCKWATSLYILSKFSECLKIADYGLSMCKETGDAVKYRTLQKIKIEASNAILVQQKKVESEKEKSNAPEKKDLPELVEASDSEVECQDVPELMDPSNSDESDSECENTNSEEKCQPSAISVDHLLKSKKSKTAIPTSKTSRTRKFSASNFYNQKMNSQVNCGKNKTEESASKASRVRKSSVSDICAPKEDADDRMKMLLVSLKDASNTLINGCGIMAMRRFRDALDEIKTAPEIHKCEEHDIICIKYAYAFACYQSGGYDDLQKAIAVLQEIIEEHKDITFPAAYYTIGLAFLKLNRFKQALQYLKTVDDILQKGIHSQVYVWPGLTVTINETKLDYLKESLPALIKECENPPSPDAVCRYESCTLQPSIYYSDPDFKGFFTINCSEQCNLQYHPLCWKNIKTAKNYSDKLFLEQQCFTPDCEGLIIKIQSISKEGILAKEFMHDDGKKIMKHKKSKLEKKLEIKEEKRRKRKDSTSRTDSTSEVPEEICNGKFSEPETVSYANGSEICTKVETKDNIGSMNGSHVSQLHANAEPFIVLKKEKFMQEMSNKIPTKIKDHRRVKNNTFSIDEFLQHTEVPLQSNAQKPITSFTTDNIQPHSSSENPVDGSIERAIVQETGQNDFPDVEFPQPILNINECLKKNIYSYFREILGKCGPLRVDDPALLEKIKSFPEEARIITDCGGIGKFLEQSCEFAFVKDTYICLVEQIPLAYRKINESLPFSDTDLKLSENYESFDLADKKCSEIFRFSGLNPDAREYMPGTSVKRHSVDDMANLKLEMEKLGRNSPELISAILKENTLKNDELNTDVEFSSQQLNIEGVIQSRRSSFSSTNSCSQNLIDVESPTRNKVTELVTTFKELFKIYFSEEIKEHKSYIDVYLKPYTIGCTPKKYTRSIQTEETERVSRGTMKTDDEIQELKDMTNQLIQERKILEQEYNAALEYATKFQNKSNVEIANLKKQLEDKLAALEGIEKGFKSREGKLEKEIKILNETLKKVKVENAAQKKEMEKLTASKDSLLLDRAHLEERIFSLQQEEQKLREDINEDGKLKNCIKKLEVEKTEAEKRAKFAELLLLQLKKTEFLKRIDIKKEEASKKIKEMQDGIAMISGSLNPLYIKSIDELVIQIRNYIALLEDIKTNFVGTIDEQLNDINKGIPLTKLKPLEVEELPDIPIWNVQQMTSMVNSQPTWGASQLGTSVYNTGSFNPFSFTPFNPLSLSSNVPGSQQTNQGQMDTPLQNGPQSPCIGSLSQPTNSVSHPPVAKAPPGIQTTVTSSFNAPVTSMLNLNSSSKQSTVNGEVNLKSTSNSNIVAATTSVGSSDGVQFAYAAAAIPDVKMPSEKISASSLELDYNVEKTPPPENTPLTVNIPPKSASAEPKRSVEKDTKKSFEKLLSKLQEKFPNYSHAELIDCVKEFRTKRKSGLSGLSLDKIINSVSEIIEDKMKSAASNVKMPDPVFKPKVVPNVVLVNKKLAAETKAKEPPPVRETSTTKKCAWGVSDSENSKQWTASEIEGCIICYEEMTIKNAYKVDCGHHFHFQCIKEWLNKKSECPFCRAHLLLPEDYPALS